MSAYPTERRASTSSSFPATSGSRFQLERDYDIQCDDLSPLVPVSEFKKRCVELYGTFGDHVTDEYISQTQIAEACKY